MSEAFESLVNLAAGIGLLGDTGVLPNVNERAGRRVGPVKVVPCFFLLVDLLDAILDVVFSAQLFGLGESGNGALMLAMTAVSVGIWIWSRRLIWRALASGYDEETVRSVILFSETSMFVLQDTCTITIFYVVPESYEGSVFSSINLVTTLICGAGVIVFSVLHQCSVVGCGEAKCCSWGSLKEVALQLGNLIYFAWGLFTFAYVAWVASFVIQNKVGSENDTLAEDSEGGHEEAAETVRGVYFSLYCFIWGLLVLINILIVSSKDLSESILRSLGLNIVFAWCNCMADRK